MRIVHLSYAHVKEYNRPEHWLKRINFFVSLLEEMSRVSEVISIHCIDYSGALQRNGVDYYFFKRTRFQLFIPSDIHNHIKKLNPEVIVVHGLHFPWQVLLLRWQVGGKSRIILQHHSEKTFKSLKGVLQQLVDRFVSAYFFPSIVQARPWVEQKQINNLEKVYEIMEVPSVFYPMDRLEARSRTQVKNGKTYLWVGRLDENKDPATLIRAFMKFIELNSDVNLYVVFQKNELIDEIRKTLSSSPLANTRIILVGKVAHDELLYWFNSADFIISTSHYEGMGVSISEAMSCGCIPILSNIPSFYAMTANGSCGLLFTPGDSESLLAALIQSEEVDIENGRARVLQQYKISMSAEAICNNMMDVFNKVTRDSR